MLVLTRKQSQQIVIGRDIRITIVKIDRNQVRLGRSAGMTILREELTRRSDDATACDDDKNEWHRSSAI